MTRSLTEKVAWRVGTLFRNTIKQKALGFLTWLVALDAKLEIHAARVAVLNTAKEYSKSRIGSLPPLHHRSVWLGLAHCRKLKPESRDES